MNGKSLNGAEPNRDMTQLLLLLALLASVLRMDCRVLGQHFRGYSNNLGERQWLE